MYVVVQAQTDQCMMHCGRQNMQGPQREMYHSRIWSQVFGLLAIRVDPSVD